MKRINLFLLAALAVSVSFGCAEGGEGKSEGDTPVENVSGEMAEADAQEQRTLIEAMNADIETMLSQGEQEVTQITVKHILIGFKGAPRMETERSKEDAETLAARLYDEIVNNGADFDALMKEHSMDSGPGKYTLTTGPAQPPMAYHRTKMVPAFGNVGYCLRIGEVGVAAYDEKNSPYGWHIIMRVS